MLMQFILKDIQIHVQVLLTGFDVLSESRVDWWFGAVAHVTRRAVSYLVQPDPGMAALKL
jgi:hypothetical protein